MVIADLSISGKVASDDDGDEPTQCPKYDIPDANEWHLVRLSIVIHNVT